MNRVSSVGIAVAAAGLLTAVPAAAQSADPDAVCLVAVRYGIERVAANDAPRAVDDELRYPSRALEGALDFYSGSLLARVPEARLPALLKAAGADAAGMSREERLARTMDCVHAHGPALRKIVAAFDAANASKD